MCYLNTPRFSDFKFLRMPLWMGTSGNTHTTHMDYGRIFLRYSLISCLLFSWFSFWSFFVCHLMTPPFSVFVFHRGSLWIRLGPKALNTTLYLFSFFSLFSLFSVFFYVSFDHSSTFCFLVSHYVQIDKKLAINPSRFVDEIIRMTRLRPSCRYLGCPLTRVLRAHLSQIYKLLDQGHLILWTSSSILQFQEWKCTWHHGLWLCSMDYTVQHLP